LSLSYWSWVIGTRSVVMATPVPPWPVPAQARSSSIPLRWSNLQQYTKRVELVLWDTVNPLLPIDLYGQATTCKGRIHEIEPDHPLVSELLCQHLVKERHKQ